LVHWSLRYFDPEKAVLGFFRLIGLGFPRMRSPLLLEFSAFWGHHVSGGWMFFSLGFMGSPDYMGNPLVDALLWKYRGSPRLHGSTSCQDKPFSFFNLSKMGRRGYPWRMRGGTFILHRPSLYENGSVY
jgi:hypothetical protein